MTVPLAAASTARMAARARLAAPRPTTRSGIQRYPRYAITEQATASSSPGWELRR